MQVHLSVPNRSCSGPCRLALKRCLTVSRPHVQKPKFGRPLVFTYTGISVPRAVAEPAAADPKAPNWQQVLQELDKPTDRKLMVCQIAPAVRVAIAETLGLAPGAVTTGQLVTGLRQLGFDFVFDTLFGADLTIMEEGHELLDRLKHHLADKDHQEEPLPMFTSCCPGWIAMVEKSNPELIPFLSTCKSPQMMMGAVIKNYFASKTDYQPQDICCVSIMPCVRKQGEADRPWFNTTGLARDVDHVVTTAELGKVFIDRNIKINELPEGEFDNPMGTGSGGALLFGTTGGVMEAALRTVYEVVSGQPMEKLNFADVRGLDGIKEAALHIKPKEGGPFQQFAGPEGEGITLNIAVANGLGNAKKIIKNLKEGTSKYDFIEVMACPGGCIGGGGQPRSGDKQILQKRQAAMYTTDERSVLRRSHENPFVQKLYDDFLGEPLGHKAHDLLHTHYQAGGVE